MRPCTNSAGGQFPSELSRDQQPLESDTYSRALSKIIHLGDCARSKLRQARRNAATFSTRTGKISEAVRRESVMSLERKSLLVFIAFSACQSSEPIAPSFVNQTTAALTD